jgi:hypothetical protein
MTETNTFDKLEFVRQYARLRTTSTPSQEEKLCNLFTEKGYVIDKDGKEHKGKDALMKYFSKPLERLPGKELLLEDGSVLASYVKKLLGITVATVTVNFEFARDKELLHRVMVKVDMF